MQMDAVWHGMWESAQPEGGAHYINLSTVLLAEIHLLVSVL